MSTDKIFLFKFIQSRDKLRNHLCGWWTSWNFWDSSRFM